MERMCVSFVPCTQSCKFLAENCLDYMYFAVLCSLLLIASMTFLFTINTFTHFKDCSSGGDDDDTSLNQSVPSGSSRLLPADDNYFAIHLISMDVNAESLTVANGGGHIMVFDFLKEPPDFSGSKNELSIQVSQKGCTIC